MRATKGDRGFSSFDFSSGDPYLFPRRAGSIDELFGLNHPEVSLLKSLLARGVILCDKLGDEVQLVQGVGNYIRFRHCCCMFIDNGRLTEIIVVSILHVHCQ